MVGLCKIWVTPLIRIDFFVYWTVGSGYWLIGSINGLFKNINGLSVIDYRFKF